MLQKAYLPIIIAVSFIIVAYLAMMTYRFLNQSRYVYFPTRRIHSTPKDIGLEYEDVYIRTVDGVNINGWFIDSGNPVTVLFFHGNGGNISDRLALIEIFRKIGLSTFIIDYRGYGKSGGKPTEAGTYRDAEAAWNYLVDEKKINPSEIILYGRSLGGPVAANIASSFNPRALILDSTFTSIKDIGSELYPYLPVKKFFKYDYNTISFLEGVSCPVLVMHSRDDSYIPIKHGQKIYNAIKGPREFAVIKGSHNNGFLLSADIYLKKIGAFVDLAGKDNH
ncbi:MAG: alpha/beta hydrolase [Actinomycetota bacterium]